MVVTVEKLDDPGQSLVLPATSGEEDLLLTSPVHSKSSGLSPYLDLADGVLYDELTAVADAKRTPEQNNGATDAGLRESPSVD